jgi:superfamily II RNA helicase
VTSKPSLVRDVLPRDAATADDATLLDCFLQWVQSTGKSLYPAQEDAILHLYEGRNVILNTPTGSGKSLVATALHFHALARGRRSFYTSPIKALANEKFLQLAAEFGPELVGMMTGDASVNPSAPIICCTAEILSNLALREGASAQVDDVIMDEFHYYSDPERGVAWQIPLLTLPQSRFLLMSATLGEMTLFEETLTRLNSRPTSIVRSRERPVPLTFDYRETPLHETIQDLVTTGRAPVYLVCFTQRECAEEAQNLLSVDICSKDEKARIIDALKGVRFSSPYGREMNKLLRHGIAIHHAGLLPRYRVLVERLAQRGLLKIICGTDTLGVGVNIPLRTVLFTKLCKYDGTKTKILSVREFHQIAGRAGRKGFDDAGFVVVQAPEHVIENKRMEMKAVGDPKRFKKLVKKKPPEFGFVMWTKDTFDRLIASEPEALVSRFNVTHGMLLNVLSRPGDGCTAMRQIIRDSHETAQAKDDHRALAFMMFRSLLSRKIIEFVPPPEASARRKMGLRVNLDLQTDFSIHHNLALYLLDTVKLCDPYSPDYALDILTLAESIIENPELILRRQLDRLKGQKVMELKMAGVEYEERMAELEKLEHPKPNREFIYETFNAFAAAHPWLTTDNIRPKSIAREMFENFMTFGEYIREYDLQRTEGLLLRYLSEVYKVLSQTVPATCKDDQMETIIDYFGAMIRGVDSSLLDEWEKLKNPAFVPEETSSEAALGAGDITLRKREFTIAIRNECFHIVKSLSRADFEPLAETLAAAGPDREGNAWTPARLKAFLDDYRATRQGPLTDRTARATEHITITQASPSVWNIRQTLVDADGHNDAWLEFECELPRSREAGRPVLRLT